MWRDFLLWCVCGHTPRKQLKSNEANNNVNLRLTDSGSWLFSPKFGSTEISLINNLIVLPLNSSRALETQVVSNDFGTVA